MLLSSTPLRYVWRYFTSCGSRLQREVEERGWMVQFARLARYIAPWPREWRGGLEAGMRFETGPGEQAQVDWGLRALCIGDVRARVFASL